SFSPNFPTSVGAVQATNKAASANGYDAFVTKLDPSGSSLMYSTYLGGTSGLDVGFAIAVDSAGDAYVTGRSASADFPTTPGAYQTTNNAEPNSSFNAFVTKLNSSGTALAYSTFLGSSSAVGAEGLGIAVDATGQAYVTGSTGDGFPTTAGAFQTTYGGTGDA